jgi:polyisoprenyl-phosphate glycosyltransferase
LNDEIQISVVSPVFKAEKIVDQLCERLVKNLEPITSNFEIILIEDGSKDNSWNKIVENTKNDKRIKGVKLSRNFGQQNAIFCGLKQTSGKWVIVMDCDLQDNPDQIINLYNKAICGYEIVFVKRKNRKDKFWKKTFAKLFYLIFNVISGESIDGTIANYGIYSKKVIKSINSIEEPFSIFSVTTKSIGFKKTSINVEHNKSLDGKSTYSILQLINFAFDYALTYTQRPLKIALTIGFSITLFSLIALTYYLTSYLNGTIKQPGFTTIVLSIWFLSGLIIFIMGIVGLYVGKTFENTKNKQKFIIDKKINLSNNENNA